MPQSLKLVPLVLGCCLLHCLDRAVRPATEKLTKRPTLVRHSISRAPPLALEALDAAAEMQEPGQKPEWWRNRRGTCLSPPVAVH